ncbi:PIF / Ping-Pong family of plant transposase [Rhynchospora pubera]|uniref:PIF / Ping-Pong family of plant transposase n=1 Tax=Rhynchospora pubera TaxID=906938 RepID=A0AAV8H7D1_9POAL|nr:PIF / Ping-Pong family of plant transposase [Rhynchospora pubera]
MGLSFSPEYRIPSPFIDRLRHHNLSEHGRRHKMEIDPSLLLLLSNLLQLQTYLDPTSDPTSPSPPPSLSSPSSFPLLFFALASAISSSLLSTSSPSPSPSPSPSLIPNSLSPLSSDPIYSLDPATRDARFRSLFGLSFSLFNSLLNSLLPHSPFPLHIPPDRALSLALSRLSRGVSSRLLSRTVSLPPSLISRCTHSVTRLLSTTLYSQFVKPLPPSSSSSSSRYTPLPNLIGSIISSPVRLRLAAPDSTLLSPNRPFPSVLLQAVADHRRVFIDACVRAPGSVDPASHLRESSLYQRASSGKLLTEPIVNLHGQKIRPYLAGDSSFPLLPFLLTPFSSSPASSSASHPSYETFDTALIKYRAESIEPAIALLKGRWKILRNLNVGLDHAAQTIMACVVLHNMCQLAKEPEDDGKYLWRDPPETLQPAYSLDSEWSMYNVAESVREALAEDLYDR